MKRLFAFFAVLFLAGALSAEKPCGCLDNPDATQPGPGVGGIAWDQNPSEQLVTEYHIYRLTGNARKLDAIVFDPVYRPAKKGTFYITAVSPYGESPPSIEVKL